MASDSPTQYFLNLHSLLNTYFNSNELVELCANLGIDHENIAPFTPKPVFTHELIKYCHLRGELNELVETCAKLRPRAKWPNSTPPLISQSPSVPGFAAFPLRAVTLAIDCTIILLGVGLLSLPFYPYVSDIDEPIVESLIQNKPAILYYVLVLAIPWFYFALQEASSLQGTLGKKLFGLKVTDENGQRIGYGKSFLRSGIKLLSLSMLGCPFIIVLLLTGLLVVFTDNKQAIHDKKISNRRV